MLRLAHNQTSLNVAVETAHCRSRQYAFRGSAGTHHRVHAAADHRGGDSSGQVAVTNQANTRPGSADVVDELFVPWPIEHDDDQIPHVAAESGRNRLQVVLDRSV